MPPTATQVIPLLTPLDTSIFLIAGAAAVVLAFLRFAHKINVPKGQWLTDATAVWTVIILTLIALSTFTTQAPFFPSFHIPPESQLIKDNGVLIPIAFIYCALMIANNIFDGIWRQWKTGIVFVVVWCKKQFVP